MHPHLPESFVTHTPSRTDRGFLCGGFERVCMCSHMYMLSCCLCPYVSVYLVRLVVSVLSVSVCLCMSVSVSSCLSVYVGLCLSVCVCVFVFVCVYACIYALFPYTRHVCIRSGGDTYAFCHPCSWLCYCGRTALCIIIPLKWAYICSDTHTYTARLPKSLHKRLNPTSSVRPHQNIILGRAHNTTVTNRPCMPLRNINF